MKFPVVLHKDPDSDYGVTVPDVPGCFSAGATVSEALANVEEALALHFEAWLRTAKSYPSRRTLTPI